ncbi:MULTISPECIES: sensor histidine kinase [Pseudoxanthomonas]|nr:MULTISPECIES: histidine kinase [Pseudoxanthomonas]
MKTDADYPLQQVLPPEVLVGSHAAWGHYRQYPVFSRPWLLGRAWLFCGMSALLATLTGTVTGLSTRDGWFGLYYAAVQFAFFCLFTMLAPVMATWVRHRGWPARRERRAVVAAVLLGIALGVAVDIVVSAHIRELVHAHGLQRTPPPDLGPVLNAARSFLELIGLAILHALLGGGLALPAYFSERRRWEEHRHARELEAMAARVREADLRLGVLQAQVEPHFLFNTLASVRALVRQDPAQAEAALDALVAFLRTAIPRLRDDHRLLSTLGQQLDICTSYLAVMQVRTGGRLSWTVRVEEALRGLPFPPALLITLVENAVKHGIEPRPGPGRVEIDASAEGGDLVVRVLDDGAGLKPGLGSGMGLANVREQLAHRFGRRASLRLQPREGGGVVAMIALERSALEEAGT